MSAMTRDQATQAAAQLKAELAKVIVGQGEVIEQTLVALAAGGHALLEGVPGLAKTLLISTLASATRLSFSRVQFTPDLMPSDITGTEVIREDKATGARDLVFLPGPIFASVVLADEINRTPPKTQAALLEAMQERQVSAGGQRRPLPAPFFVLATQNPIEQEGTYPLPEAQLDRFLLKIVVGYPSEADELEVIKRTTGSLGAKAQPVLEGETLLALQALVRETPVADGISRYALALVRATRPVKEGGHPEISPLLQWGAGPRAGQSLVICAKARATLQGRIFVMLDDIKAMAKPVLRHRLHPSYEAEAQGLSADTIIDRVVGMVKLPASDLEKDPMVAQALTAST
ncbi:MAG TPA: MoxR family ATPase [Planctomycetota bacterium]|nr:MoxR family ATPase [Planctomycetota bacterium]